MLKRFLAFAAIVGVAIGVMAGCDNTGEQQRSQVVVSSVNLGAPVVVDVLEQGDSVYAAGTTNPVTNDDFIAQDWLILQLQNFPYNPLVVTEPGLPHGDFLITHYDVQWTRTDGGTTTLPPYTGYTNQVVPSGVDDVFMSILLVTFDNKNLPVLADLCYICANSGDEILMRADITLYGHEVGTERETEIEFSVGVSFVDLVIATGDK